MPKPGDLIVLKNDVSLNKVTKFTAQVQVIDCPNGIKPGYCPIVFVRTSRAPCKVSEIKWRMGKETNNQKVNNPPELKQNDSAEIVMEPQMPFIVDKFSNCEGLGRIAVMDGNSVVMLGKVVDTVDETK